MIRVCINTQTPPLRPRPGVRPGGRRVWRLDEDYVPNVGGVIPMMRSFLRTTTGRWVAPAPRWVALGAPELPGEVRTDEGYILETVPLDGATRGEYTRFKEAVWRSFHGPWGLGSVATRDYLGFVQYNHRTAEHLLRRANEYDIFYVNDFQQILVGGLIGSAAPAVLQWHIPLEFRGYPEPVRRFFLRSMEGFDGIVVSTRAGLEELIRRGFHGRAFQVYPYLDPEEHLPASAPVLRRFLTRFGLEQSEYVLSVGRLDPVKRQDLLIEAFRPLKRRFRRLKLVLAGGGSFSTRELGRATRSDKAAQWGEVLQRAIRRHHLEDSVVLTGSLTSEELRAAYDGASVFAHPAPWEGFGLVVVEAWLHHLPVVVSRGAGVAELVNDGVNGSIVPPGSSAALAQRLGYILSHPELARSMGDAGALTARLCHARRAAARLREIFARAIQSYHAGGTLPPRRLLL